MFVLQRLTGLRSNDPCLNLWGGSPSNTSVAGIILDLRAVGVGSPGETLHTQTQTQTQRGGVEPEHGLWKLLIGKLPMNGWQGPQFPNASTATCVLAALSPLPPPQHTHPSLCHARARAPVSDGWVSPCWRNNELLPAGLLRHKNLTVEIPAACFAWIRTQQVEIDPLLLLIICGL